MRLRVARKICWNDYYDRCNYSAETLRRAFKKYQPYNIRDCAKKNKELKEQGSSIRYVPYMFKETTGTFSNHSTPKITVKTRYAKVEVKKDLYPELAEK